MQLEDEKTEVHKELNEIDVQLQDDLDTEIEISKVQFETKLTESRESTLKYKGENGIMNKKNNLMQREIDETEEEKAILEEREKELHDKIKLLEKEVSTYKKEIKAKDLVIGEREKKIYELKKKNQELDKFKFVLDFMIRELKMQIEPRQNEIISMREKIKAIDLELEKLHKTNADLDSLIGVMKERIETLQKDIKTQRQTSKTIENKISHFRSDVQLAIQHILSPSLLKTSAQKLIVDHGGAGAVKPRLDPEVEREYNRHKDYLAKAVHQLKKTLEESVTSHMNINNQLMKTNMTLIGDINAQRESNRQLKGKVQAGIGSVRHHMQQKKKGGGGGLADLGKENRENSKISDFASIVFTNMNNDDNANADFKEDNVDPTKVLDRNGFKMKALRDAIAELEKRTILSNSYSREMLPPMEGGGIESSVSNNNNNSNSNSFKMLLPPVENNNLNSSNLIEDSIFQDSLKFGDENLALHEHSNSNEEAIPVPVPVHREKNEQDTTQEHRHPPAGAMMAMKKILTNQTNQTSSLLPPIDI